MIAAIIITGLVCFAVGMIVGHACTRGALDDDARRELDYQRRMAGTWFHYFREISENPLDSQQNAG